ncbi:MAG: hypothetical protein IPK11_05920 [Ignavibacteria bacterium]|nr:hypothetical protein [Ignavibacteria bacterium]
MAQIKEKYFLPILTDIHIAEEALTRWHVFADILQILLFMRRLTDTLIAAAKTGKTVNIKKDNFLLTRICINKHKKSLPKGNPNVAHRKREQHSAIMT